MNGLGLLCHSKQTLRGTVGKMNLYHQEDAFLQRKAQVIDWFTPQIIALSTHISVEGSICTVQMQVLIVCTNLLDLHSANDIQLGMINK